MTEVVGAEPDMQNDSNRTRLHPNLALPVEILELIFSDLASGAFESTLDEPYIPQHIYSPRWIVVTHVCRHWRQVALSCPSLWTRPSFQNLHMATEMMDRSHSLPLVVHVDLLPTEKFLFEAHASWCLDEAKAKALGGNMDRIKSLCINYPSHQTHGRTKQRQISGAMGPAPLLESLTVFHNNERRTTDTLPLDLFNGEAPRLRHIQLRNCTLSWTESFLSSFRSLRTLSMQYTQWYSPQHHLQQQSATQMMRALYLLPQLQALILRGVLRLMEPPSLVTSERSKVANFPSLQYLSLSAAPDLLAFVMSHIDYPTSTHVRLGAHPKSLDWSDRPHVAETLRLLDARLESNMRFLSLDSNPKQSSVTASTLVPTNSDTIHSTENPSQFTYTMPCQSIVDYACDSLILDSLEFVKVSTVLAPGVVQKIGRSSNLRTLDVDKEMVGPFIALLSTSSLQPPAGPAFPCLNNLILRRAVISSRQIMETVASKGQQITPISFKNCLLARKNYGAALKRLELIDCSIPSEYSVSSTLWLERSFMKNQVLLCGQCHISLTSL